MTEGSDLKGKQSLTLLELSRKQKNPPPPPLVSESSDSDFDEPPVATPRKPSLELTPRKSSQQAEQKSLASRRSSRTSPKLSSRPRIKSFSASSASCSGRDNIRLLRSSSTGFANVPSTHRRRSTNRSESASAPPNGDPLNTTPRPRSYYIKAIRRGIPDTLTTDTQGRTRRIINTKIIITPYCVCHRASTTKYNGTAWLFSLVVLLLCVLCPIASFTVDITFFAICKNNFHQINAILEKVQHSHEIPKAANLNRSIESEESLEKQRNLPDGFDPHRFGQKTNSQVEEVKNNLHTEETTASLHRVVKISDANHKTKQEKYGEVVLENEHKKIMNSSVSNSNIKSANMNIGLMSTCHNIPTSNTCASESELINYMTTIDARLQLEGYKHVITDVFEPIFIIGSFASFLLCIFARLVIMVTPHDHFLSAYVMNMVTMPLSLASGALSFNAASYYVGPLGFECWNCVRTANCSASALLDPALSSALSAVLVSKVVDGFAGGCVLFVVLLRLIWSDDSHVTCFWNFFRGLVSVASLTLCITLTVSMVMMPGLAVFQFTLLEKLPYFDERQSLCHHSMSLLVLGITAWAASLFVLVVYLIYRTFVYCRVREHPNKEVLLL